jgi:hypothetical protein
LSKLYIKVREVLGGRSQREKLELLATLPMQPKRARHQKPCDLGLFDDVARNQMDLF